MVEDLLLLVKPSLAHLLIKTNIATVSIATTLITMRRVIEALIIAWMIMEGDVTKNTKTNEWVDSNVITETVVGEIDFRDKKVAVIQMIGAPLKEAGTIEIQDSTKISKVR